MSSSAYRERPPAYVGLSGIMARSEVEAALAAFPDCGRQLMVGLLASEKTLAGVENRYPRRYPRREDIAGIFSNDPRCLNLVHVAVDGPMGLGRWLDRAMRAGGPRCHGIQVNMTPIAFGATRRQIADAFAYFRLEFPSARLVAQVRVLGAVLDHAEDWALMMAGFGATDLLLDWSGGAGKAIDPARAQDLCGRLGLPGIGLAIAGGLCAETIPGVAHLIRDGISCDSEGRLRDGADGGGRLVQEKVDAYLRAAGEAVSR